jgi:hypothetical protein
VLKVTIEIVPFGVKSATRTLALISIGNKGTGTPEYGNYEVTLTTGSGKHICDLDDYDRSKGYLPLIREVFNKLNRLKHVKDITAPRW